MGLLGSAFGRALAGGGVAAADVASRYIDEDLLKQRQQAFADIQRTSAKNIREDDDAFRNDPTRTARDRSTKVADIEAEGGARNRVALEGKRAEVSDKGLLQAAIDNTNALTRGTTDAKVDAQSAMNRAQNATDLERAAAMLPTEVKRAYALAEAQAKAAAKYREGKTPPGAELTAKLAIVEQTLGRPLTEPEKLGLLGLTKSDPERDKEEVEYDQAGNVTGRKVTSTRRPGAKPGESVETPTPDTIKKMAANMDNPQAVAEFKKRFGSEALAQISAQGKPAPKTAAPTASMDRFVNKPIGQKSDAELRIYTANHPDYAVVQEELQRRLRQGYGGISNPDRYRSQGP